MAFYPDERIALFIDGSNLYSTTKTLDFDIDYGKLLDLFKGKGRLIRANYYTALVEDDDYSPIRPLIDWLEYNGWHAVTKPAKSQVDRDGRRRIKGDILFSGDGDFRVAVEAIQKKGVRVTVVSTMKSKPAMLADELRRQADAFIEIADMDKLFGRPKRGYEDDD